MRKLIISTFALLAVMSADAQTPEEITREYFAKIQTRQWSDLAGFFDPVSLKEFRNLFDFLDAIPKEEVRQQVLAMFFGKEMSLEKVKKLSDAQFFNALMSGLLSTVVKTGRLNFDRLEIIGSIPEGQEFVHVLTRNRLSVGKVSGEKLEVLTFKRVDGLWKMTISGKMADMALQLRRSLGL